MKQSKQKTILVTGASTGIGFYIAQKLTEKGHHVIGVARSQPIQAFDFTFMKMDVTDIESIELVKANVLKTFGKLDVLINNAGYGIAGAIEETSVSDLRKLFDVNVFGLHLVSRTFLPLLKQSKGLIVNIGSVAGDFTIPFQTGYSMTKASVAAYSEGLRLELKPFSVRVVNVKPGDTQSNFFKKRELITTQESPYKDRLQRSIAVMEKDEKNGMHPHSVFRIVQKLMSQKNPPVSVTVGMSYKILQILKRMLPEKLIQFLLYKIYGR
jgi:short-subunit dehydrogenase